MSYPKKFNREREPLRNLFLKVTDKQQYLNNDGTYKELKFKFKSPRTAEYNMQRMHALYRAVTRESVEMHHPAPKMPHIQRLSNVLTFSFTRLYKQSWMEVEKS